MDEYHLQQSVRYERFDHDIGIQAMVTDPTTEPDQPDLWQVTVSWNPATQQAQTDALDRVQGRETACDLMREFIEIQTRIPGSFRTRTNRRHQYQNTHFTGRPPSSIDGFNPVSTEDSFYRNKYGRPSFPSRRCIDDATPESTLKQRVDRDNGCLAQPVDTVP